MVNESHPITSSLEQRDRDSLLHPFTRADDFAAGRVPGQRIVQSASGIRVTDAHGRSVIDGMSGMYCVNVGYGRKAIVDAIAEQASELPYYHIFAGASHPKAILLAEKLIALTGGRMKRVFFGLSGSDANETQIKLVWYYHNIIGKPHKKKIIARQRGYHGATTMTASLTGLPNYHSGFDLPFALVKHTIAPDAFWAPETDPRAFSQRCAYELEQLILEEGPDTVGAFIAEPVVGSGGILPPPPGYWEAIQPVLRKYDVLLIADEVMAGFGRTGKWFAIDHSGVVPDMITMAKGLTSAYVQLGALGMRRPIADHFAEKVFGGGLTYNSHPLACATALATIEVYEEDDLITRGATMGKTLRAHHERMKAKHPCVGPIRNIGLFGIIELVRDPKTQEPIAAFNTSAPEMLALGAFFRKNGLYTIVRWNGFFTNPPLIITNEELDFAFDVIDRGLTEVDKALGLA